MLKHLIDICMARETLPTHSHTNDCKFDIFEKNRNKVLFQDSIYFSHYLLWSLKTAQSYSESFFFFQKHNTIAVKSVHECFILAVCIAFVLLSLLFVLFRSRLLL